jgi:hypothetical protein
MFYFGTTGAPIEGMLFESPCPHQGAAQGASVSLKPPTNHVEQFESLVE